MRESIANHMAYAHQCVTEASVRFLEAFRRYNYTTPKSYLELISLYKQLLEVRLCVRACVRFCVLFSCKLINELCAIRLWTKQGLQKHFQDSRSCK